MSKTPIGVIKNNPFDLMYDPHYTWIGQIEPQPSGTRLLSFDTAVHGLRAGMIDARTKVYTHGYNTIDSFIEKFAPCIENDTEQYKDNMSLILNMSIKTDIVLKTTDDFIRWAKAICQCEVGTGWYTDAQFLSAARMVVGT